MSEFISNIAEIERLHKSYLDLRENTPDMKRNGEECKAYHAWYDAAYVFFSSIDGLNGKDDYTVRLLLISPTHCPMQKRWNIIESLCEKAC